MKICKCCIQPDTRPGIFFDENGKCGACIWEEEKKNIDWNQREEQLQEIAQWAKKTTKSDYDCVIGVSGGKDSTYQAITARDSLGLRCLLVHGEPDGRTEIGNHNIENLKKLGFDVISLRPNPKIMQKLVTRDFYKYGNPQKVTEFSLYSSAYIIADMFNIPLIIQGENAGLTLGVSKTGLGKGYDALKINESNTLSTGWEDYLTNGITKKDMWMFHYDRKSLENKGVKAIWIQYFLKDWDLFHNASFAEKYGFKGRSADFDCESIGTFLLFSQIDSDLVQVTQMLKHVKFGFGQAMDHACYGIRSGKFTRKEAIQLVKKYDGKCSEYYIKKLCDYMEISIDEFWKVANSFRGKMWKKLKDGSWYNTYWNYLEEQDSNNDKSLKDK
ncbi:MAG: N-acetyl sugar amidotransferase [Thaumarchaeota archaeon]|jgi:N-acetyl sugar amidotransferase|nr:MAG: N-acetyl sugar amidotransferase [Nitrososphaerota archaeon]